MSNHFMFHRWNNMVARCHRASSDKYKHYGARGISVCERWRSSFETFLADVGYPPNNSYTLERKNNDGNYEPGNVKWATRTEQARNRRTSHTLTFNGETKTIAEWAEVTGITATAIYLRIGKLGHTVERALTQTQRAYYGRSGSRVKA